jgi:hypothetical protein
MSALQTEPNTVLAQQQILAFALAADRGDALALDALLHPAFRVVFSVKTAEPGGKPTMLDRDQFLGMVRDGKIGGKERAVSVSGICVSNGFACAAATMLRPDAAFYGTYSLVEEAGRWQLLQEAVMMVPAGAIN